MADLSASSAEKEEQYEEAVTQSSTNGVAVKRTISATKERLLPPPHQLGSNEGKFRLINL